MILNRIYSLITKGSKRKKEALFANYLSILTEHFQYFNDLSVTEKNRFLHRVHKFRKSKNFHLVNQDDNIAIEVMISAAAVQVTFGLATYTMDFFDDIFVMRDAYTYGFSNVPWAGHVNHRGIHISWNHFMQGYKYKNDRYNVGLHEMAHAMEYEFHYGNYANEETLRPTYDSVMRIVEGVLFHEEWKAVNIFTEEGLKNKHECWAESVELFFENPGELKIYYPDLYNGIKKLLNQDPVANIVQHH